MKIDVEGDMEPAETFKGFKLPWVREIRSELAFTKSRKVFVVIY